MKKFFLILSLPLFIAASCSKNNDVIPDPPDPPPVEYKATIAITFNVPASVQLSAGDDMWILDAEKEQLTNRITVTLPTTTVVLTGDVAKNNLGKKVYLYFSFGRVIGVDPYLYDVRKAFTLEKTNILVFNVPDDRDGVTIFDP